jgi:cytochrome P450
VLDKIPILPAPKKGHEAKKELDSLVYGLISDRRQQAESNSSSDSEKRYNDLLTRLLNAQDSNASQVRPSSNAASTSTSTSTSTSNDGKMSDKQVRDEVMTIFIAGHETTANALTWTFFLLSQYPDIEKKLHDEIDSVLGTTTDEDGHVVTKIPTPDDIPRLQYTEKILRESMRLYPPVWTMGRYVENDYNVGEYTILAGSSILMSQYVMHHDPRYYEEPEQFNPDRWTTEFKTQLPRFSYFPFGGGIRGCIGEPFAWMEGILIIAIIAQKWTMRLVPGQRIKLDPAITLRPKNGMKMKLIQRK